MAFEFVLDASALLALLRREVGMEVVWSALPLSVVSALNHAEAVTRLIDLGRPFENAALEVEMLALPIRDFSKAASLAAAELRASTKGHGLSLADRACLALAREEGLVALTADRARVGLNIGVEVRLIR